MKIVIIEDDKLLADELEKVLKQINAQIQNVVKLENVTDAIAWLQNNTADLIFSDIQLGDQTAFEIFEAISIPTPIIFTTGYDHYTIQAFKTNGIDYLLKPINKEELTQSMNKFISLKMSFLSDITSILKNIHHKDETDYQKRFMVVSGERIKSVPIYDVAYFLGHQKNVLLITHQNEQFIVDFTLEKLDKVLNPNQFFRINRQFIVSFESIKQMNLYSKSRVKLDLLPTTKEDTIVSIDRSGDFKEWLNR